MNNQIKEKWGIDNKAVIKYFECLQLHIEMWEQWQTMKPPYDYMRTTPDVPQLS